MQVLRKWVDLEFNYYEMVLGKQYILLKKNTDFTTLSTDWILLNLDINQDNYGIKLFYDQIESAHADLCFSNIMITHSIY